MHLLMMSFQGVWSMEGQQSGSGEAGRLRGQRGPVSAPRSRVPTHRPPAGEAAEPADHHRGPDQEIRNAPPPLGHSGRYRQHAAFTLLLMGSGGFTRGAGFYYKGGGNCCCGYFCPSGSLGRRLGVKPSQMEASFALLSRHPKLN